MSTTDEAAGLELAPPQIDPEGHRAELRVSADSPWFSGHFPGDPLLPGIAQLVVALRLHPATGGNGRLRGIDGMRFNAPIRPGDHLVAHLGRQDAEGRASFRLLRPDGVEVSSGRLRWGSPSADEVSDPPEDGPPGESQRPQLPHAGPSRLVTGFIARGSGRVEAAGSIPVGHASVRDGRAPAVVAVELAAQGAAQVPAAQTRRDGAAGDLDDAARSGYLVRIRDVRFSRTELETDTPFVAHLTLAGRTGPLSRFDFVVVEPTGEPLAAGSLATWDDVAET